MFRCRHTNPAQKEVSARGSLLVSVVSLNVFGTRKGTIATIFFLVSPGLPCGQYLAQA